MRISYIFFAVVLGILLFSELGCPSSKRGRGSNANSLQIKGSDTEVNLVQRLAEAFMARHKGAKIAVTGGGSGTGIAALFNGTTDLANSSRPMKPKELSRAKKKGITPVGVVFAMDALSVITHPSNPLKSLTLEQLGLIYRGKIRNFKEVGGPDLEINLYGRQSNSGTFVYFRDTVLKGDYSPKMKNMPGNSAIVAAVKNDRSGIGYVGIGYVVKGGKKIEGVHIVPLKRGEEVVDPLHRENIRSGKYPLARPLYQYCNGKPTGLLLKFLQFELSEDGQKIVEEEGFYPVTPQYREANKKLGL
ncbi:MAG: PstS family phosphate ABC transporter substrate-binding protein [Planctomycetota bacterium]|nr:MAG: PstS family phosphate ABC transporter substrate-binding protein [Planctomycetota bacterium]